MKKIFYKIFPILSVAFMMTLTGCLTDTEYENGVNGIKPAANNFVEVHLTSAESSNFVTHAYDQFNRDTTITKFIPINLTSGPATSDVTVTFKLLDASSKNPILDTLIVHGNPIPDPTKFVVLNANNQVVIPAGSQTGYIKVKFNPSNFGGFYAFGIQITAISDPKYAISNLAYGYVKFGIKNIYDANYLCKGYRIRPGNPTEAVADGTIEPFNTLNSNTVIKKGFGNYTAYSIKIEVTTNTIVVGGVTCFKVNATPVNDAGVVVGGMFTTWTGDATTLPAPPTNPLEINYYNPVTQVFVLNCYYTSAVNRIMYEVLTRQ